MTGNPFTRRHAMFGALIAGAAIALPAMAIGAPRGNAGYLLVMRTSDKKKAGTDADVECRLVGERGETGWIVLDGDGDDRERGNSDFYTVEGDLGKIKEVYVRAREESGDPDGPEWHLKDVLVFRVPDLGTIANPLELFMRTINPQDDFVYNDWVQPAPFAARGSTGEWTTVKLRRDGN